MKKTKGPKRTEKYSDQENDDGEHHCLGHVGNGSPDEEAHDAAEDGEHADREDVQEEGPGVFRKSHLQEKNEEERIERRLMNTGTDDATYSWVVLVV